ncbi:MAG: sugar phosphate isomerase/epimerase [Kiritimatiellae bacterium]|nr:sugar phosphate isomerase/epimerase [Kiritimatiellia bacterium]
MARKVTLFTGQWADLPFATVAERASEMGYDGLELSCWGDFIDVEKGAKSKAYCEDRLAKLNEYGLGCWAISNHLSGQLVCDELDERHNPFAPEKIRGDYKAMRKWAIDMQKKAAKTAANLGIGVVNGFTGSPIWKYLYSYPPCPPGLIDNGFKTVAKTWKPILDYYADLGVRFALEVHPTEIAFDIASAERLLDALDGHPAFGFNYDPSHFGYQGVDYVKFIRTFKDRIYHVHIKDAWWGHGDGTVGVFGGHTEFADPRRYWDFRSPGHGDINFEEIIVALNDIKYAGPLSVEWEDSRMDRFHGAQEACDFVHSIDFAPSAIAFDGQFES